VQYLRIANWEEYQHYSDRKPPWIKLYHELLDDYEYACLDTQGQLLLYTLFLLASRTDNEIPADPAWVKQRGTLSYEPDFEPLIELGFLEYVDGKQGATEQDDSVSLSPCKHKDSKAQALARSRESESEAESETDAQSAPAREEELQEVPSDVQDTVFSNWGDDPDAMRIVADLCDIYSEEVDWVRQALKDAAERDVDSPEWCRKRLQDWARNDGPPDSDTEDNDRFGPTLEELQEDGLA